MGSASGTPGRRRGLSHDATSARSPERASAGGSVLDRSDVVPADGVGGPNLARSCAVPGEPRRRSCASAGVARPRRIRRPGGHRRLLVDQRADRADRRLVAPSARGLTASTARFGAVRHRAVELRVGGDGVHRSGPEVLARGARYLAALVGEGGASDRAPRRRPTRGPLRARSDATSRQDLRRRRRRRPSGRATSPALGSATRSRRTPGSHERRTRADTRSSSRSPRTCGALASPGTSSSVRC